MIMVYLILPNSTATKLKMILTMMVIPTIANLIAIVMVFRIHTQSKLELFLTMMGMVFQITANLIATVMAFRIHMQSKLALS